jgi:hypothetical protein
MFLFLMQKCGFELFNLNVLQLKSSSFSCQWCPLLLSKVCPSSKGSTKDWKNLNVSKLEIHVGVQDFLSRAFEHFYIVIWSCMLLKDVFEILPLLMPKILINQFVFV